MLNNQYTDIIKQDQGWWIGWIEEVPGTNCQEETREALLDCLKVVLAEALDQGIVAETDAPSGVFKG
jgi:predicted RNase H-like HicB family nuclease